MFGNIAKLLLEIDSIKDLPNEIKKDWFIRFNPEILFSTYTSDSMEYQIKLLNNLKLETLKYANDENNLIFLMEYLDIEFRVCMHRGLPGIS